LSFENRELLRTESENLQKKYENTKIVKELSKAITAIFSRLSK